MFKSILYIKYLGFNKDTEEHKSLFKIIDNDFEEECQNACQLTGAPAAHAAGAVITCYENKNLPVAKNLIKFFIFNKERYNYEIKNQISWNLKYQKLYPKYHNEIEKFIILM